MTLTNAQIPHIRPLLPVLGVSDKGVLDNLLIYGKCPSLLCPMRQHINGSQDSTLLGVKSRL